MVKNILALFYTIEPDLQLVSDINRFCKKAAGYSQRYRLTDIQKCAKNYRIRTEHFWRAMLYKRGLNRDVVSVRPSSVTYVDHVKMKYKHIFNFFHHG